MSPQDPQAAALLAHVVSQVEQNVQFLASQNYISQADASAILTKLPNPNHGVTQITNGVAKMPLATRAVPVASGIKQAKALWPYNENGQVSSVFTFVLTHGGGVDIIINPRIPMTCRSPPAMLSRL